MKQNTIFVVATVAFIGFFGGVGGHAIAHAAVFSDQPHFDSVDVGGSYSQHQPLGSGWSGDITSLDIFGNYGPEAIFNLCDSGDTEDFCQRSHVVIVATTTDRAATGAENIYDYRFSFPAFTLDPAKYYFMCFGQFDSGSPNTCTNTPGTIYSVSSHGQPMGWPSYPVYWAMKWNAVTAFTPSITLSSLHQYKSDAATIIDEGNSIAEETVAFGAVLASDGPAALQLQIEVESASAAFTGTPNVTSTFVASGNTAMATFTGVNGAYHWQARAVDADGNISAWQTLSSPAANPDFIIRNPASDLILHDSSTGYGISTQPNPCWGATMFDCALSPAFKNYIAGYAFPISKITFDWQNNGNNNCDGLGNYGAIISSAGARETIIATSTDAAYFGCGGQRGVGELHFRGEEIPSNFYLTFGAFDGALQGGSAISVSNVAIYSSASQKEPIIIVPGIMGSRLNTSSTGEEIWPNVSKMLASGSDDYLDVLKLATNGQPVLGSAAVYPSDILREATGTLFGIPISGEFYGNLVQKFIQSGYKEGKDLFVVPYDWRLDVSSQADALAAKIAEARALTLGARGKVNLVAHSMGGLLVKKYLDGLTDPSFVDKVILAGAPEIGAPKAFTILNYGDDLDLKWLGFFGLNPREVKSITQNMPSAYQLLPSRRYVQVAGPYVHDFRGGNPNQFLDYDKTTAFMASDPADSRNAALLGAADTFHQGTDARSINAARVYNIVGCSNPTVTGFNLYDNGAVDVSRGNGDGVVPALSAMNLADGYANYFVQSDKTAIDHLGLVQDSRVLTLIKNIIDSATSTSALPDGISTASVDCFDPGSDVSGGSGMMSDTTFEFSVHNSALIDAYDGASRHTGLTPSGDIELGIPSSTYEAIGENAFITVPSAGAYKIVAHGPASGKVAVKIKGYKGSVLDRVAAYPSISLQGSSTKGELTFSGFSGDMGFKVIDSGTSTVPTVVQPVAVLTTPSSTADIMPPVISVTAIPAEIKQNATATISWTALDTDSGMATTTATLNGSLVMNGQTISFSQAGDALLVITAIDNAGNSAAKEMHINVIPVIATTTPKTISIPLSADTYIARQAPNQNRGKENLLRLQDEQWRRESRILLGVSPGRLHQALGANATSIKIISAKLTLVIANNRRDWEKRGGTVELYRLTQPWTENGATWNCPKDIHLQNHSPNCKVTWNMNSTTLHPWASTSTANFLMANNTSGTITLDITEDVRAFLSGTIPDDGWILKKAQESLPGLVDFYSRESLHKPKLTITYQ